ncbi:hypothetical protein [Paraclostridium sordellii]|uniref:Uncharacterized protein n=1 Tax=Paraclostridium sordellii TaxID=1505 RepID=A0A9P1L267_PARSO|nr:hypothetical protein [Paeniclostridium sordellii]CEO35902.1 Uncharacterised protein [[Clostridium] sordellii] [Paeniclostridium sordellii]
MTIIKNLEQLKSIYNTKILDRYMYEYISNILEKSEKILKRGQLIIAIGKNIDKDLEYCLKWKRYKLINNVRHREEFYIKDSNGILLIIIE